MCGKTICLALAALLLVPQPAWAADGPAYPGVVRPMIQSVHLRYSPTSLWRQDVLARTVIKSQNNRAIAYRVIMEGPVVAVGERLEWRQSIWAAPDRPGFHDSEPTITANITTDSRGIWTEFKLSGTNPNDGSLLRKGIAAYDEMAASAANYVVALPANPVG